MNYVPLMSLWKLVFVELTVSCSRKISIMGSLLQEQFEEFQWRMGWLKEPAQALFLAEANQLYLVGTRAPSEDWHIQHYIEQAEQGHEEKPRWMQKYIWTACWHSCALMIDASLNIGSTGKKTVAGEQRPFAARALSLLSTKTQWTWTSCVWWFLKLPLPRDPGSPKLRMVSWNLNTLAFRFGDCTPLKPHHLTFSDWIFLQVELDYMRKEYAARSRVRSTVSEVPSLYP